jgi:alcohol dehydrogenase class IV
MDFSFFMPVRVIGGEGCVRQSSRIFRSLGKRAFIITGAGSAKKSGALDDVTGVLDHSGISYSIFDGIMENPRLSVVAEAGKRARDAGADYIIAIGGGSVIDAARAASVFAARDISPREDIYKGTFSEHMPFVCVGTTAGTGSEVDDIAVVTEDSTGKKRAVKKDFLFAEYTFCDYRYTMSMNLRQTVSTALDALCHCLESWLNTAASEPVVCAARRGAELIYPRLRSIAENGPRSFDPSDKAMRKDIYHGSLWGGIAISHAGTGFPHPAGYVLTERGGVPHGVACALFEPAFLRRSARYASPEDTAALGRIAGSAEEIAVVIEALCQNDIALSAETRDEIALRAGDSANIKKTLGGYTAGDVRREAERLFPDSGSETTSGRWRFGEDI